MERTHFVQTSRKHIQVISSRRHDLYLQPPGIMLIFNRALLPLQARAFSSGVNSCNLLCLLLFEVKKGNLRNCRDLKNAWEIGGASSHGTVLFGRGHVTSTTETNARISVSERAKTAWKKRLWRQSETGDKKAASALFWGNLRRKWSAPQWLSSLRGADSWVVEQFRFHDPWISAVVQREMVVGL